MQDMIVLEKPGTTPMNKSVEKSTVSRQVRLEDVLPKCFLDVPIVDEEVDAQTIQALMDARRGVGVTVVDSFQIK